MAFKISEFAAALNKQNGIINPAHFDIQIAMPKLLNYSGAGDTLKILPQFCMSASLPGFTLQSADIKMWGLGIPQKRPVGGSYNDLQLQFIVDGKSDIPALFHRWGQLIMQTDGSANYNEKVNQLNVTEFSYPEEYDTTITINVYDPNGKKTITYSVYYAYPLSYSDIPVTWDGHDEFMRMSVVFTYDYWKSDKFGSPYQNDHGANGRAAGPV